jgi:hypothetical protein
VKRKRRCRMKGNGRKQYRRTEGKEGKGMRRTAKMGREYENVGGKG